MTENEEKPEGIEKFKHMKLPKVQRPEVPLTPADEVEVNPPKEYSHEVSDMVIADLAGVQPMTNEAGQAFRMRQAATMAKDTPPEPKPPWYGREAAGLPEDHRLFGMSVVEVGPEEIDHYLKASWEHLEEWRRYYHEDDWPEGARPEPRPYEPWPPIVELLALYISEKAAGKHCRLYWYRSSQESFMQLAGREGYALEHGDELKLVHTVMS